MYGRQMDLADMQARLTAWLQGKMPHVRNLSISPLERSSGGLSNETFFFDMYWQEAGQSKSAKKVLRWQPKDFQVFPSYDLGMQFRVMECLQGTDVPVPKVNWLEEDEEVLDSPFYVMDRIDGVIPCEVPPYHSYGIYFEATPEQRAKMWWGSLDAATKVHKVDWEGTGLSFLGIPSSGTGPVDKQLDYWENYLSWIKEDPQESHPTLEAALDWLKENRYTPEHVTLCWGDARMPNTIYGHDFDVLGVLDWEMAYIGDPESDLGWYFFLDWQYSDGYGIPRLQGTPEREETIQRYEELTGWKVKNLFYSDVMAAFRFGVIMARIAKNMKATGVPTPTEDFERDNPCTQRLAGLLDLPDPGGPKREVTIIEEVTVTVQLHLTGPGGSDWYLISDKGKGTRHEGTVQNPKATCTASAKDWDAIQKGELDRVQAFMSGKLNIEGDLTLMMQLEEMISKHSYPG